VGMGAGNLREGSGSHGGVVGDGVGSAVGVLQVRDRAGRVRDKGVSRRLRLPVEWVI